MIETIYIDSKALNTTTTLKVILPECCSPKKIFVLLHGKLQHEGSFSLIENLPEELGLEELCDNYQLLIVIPYMKNCYYISTEEYNCDKFVTQELPALIRKIYSISDNTEMILGGISMGGYGASLIASHTDIFKKVISISGAYIANDVLIGNPEVWGNILPTNESAKGSYLYYFLPLNELLASTDKNAFAALSMFSRNQVNPVFIVTCGTEDWMYTRNLKFLNELKALNIIYEFFQIIDGKHDEDCFREGLWKAFEALERYECE